MTRIYQKAVFAHYMMNTEMELKGRIREAIMKMILEFDIKIE